MTDHRAGKVFTFYSYKGGTGRTMALANLACLLARTDRGHGQTNPRGVLAIDWDFEAPGLHRYLRPYLTTEAENRFDEAEGCLELIDRLGSTRSDCDPAEFVSNRQRARTALEAIDLGPYLLPTQLPALSLMKAGRFDDEYPRRVSEFDWKDLFRRTVGLFVGIADFLRSRFDYILVDSRTGITDAGGICTMVLPDKLVVVFTPNQQSLTGIENLVRKAVTYRKGSPDGRPLTVFPLPSRVEMARPQLLEGWRHGGGSDPATTALLPHGMLGYQPTFERLFAEIYRRPEISLGDYFNEVMLQHIPDYAYGEPVAVMLESSESRISLSRSYAAFLDRLIEINVPWDSLSSARRERDIVRRCDAIAAKLSKGEIEESIQLAFGIIELKPFASLFELAAHTILDVAAAAYPRNRTVGSALIGESARLAVGEESEIDPTTLGQVLLDAGKLSGKFGDLVLATELYEAGHKVFCTNFGAEHPVTVSVMSQLASVARSRGDLHTRPERILAVCQSVLGDEHPDTLTAMSSVAHALWDHGDRRGATALEEQVFAIRLRVLGEEHPDTLTSMNNLASTLYAQGDLDGARSLQEKVLSIRRRVLGEEHPDTLTSMNNLALMLRAQGDLSGARSLQEQVLSIIHRVLGEEHPNTLRSMNNLASTLHTQGDLNGARSLQEQVLSIIRRVLGEEHPDTLTSMNDLALTLHAQGDLNGARLLQEQVLSIRRRVLGEEHPDTLASMNNLALTLRGQGELSGARALEEQALSIRRRVLGEEHPDTLASMDNLAITLRAQGDLNVARLLQEQVLSIGRRVLGEEHPDTLNAMIDLAGTLQAQGDHSGALAMQEEALAGSRRVLGNEHPRTLAVMGNLARTLLSMGLLSEAQKIQEEALAVQFGLPAGDKSRYQMILKGLPAAEREAEVLLKTMSAREARARLIIGGYGEAMAESAIASAAARVRQSV